MKQYQVQKYCISEGTQTCLQRVVGAVAWILHVKVEDGEADRVARLHGYKPLTGPGMVVSVGVVGGAERPIGSA